MRFYCEKCGTVSDLTERTLLIMQEPELDEVFGEKWDGETLLCDICTNESQEIWMKKISDYETPEQYKKRTGKPWSKYAPVWYRYSNDEINWSDWNLSTLRFIEFTKRNLKMLHIQRVCANSNDGKHPPYNWRPE